MKREIKTKLEEDSSFFLENYSTCDSKKLFLQFLSLHLTKIREFILQTVQKIQPDFPSKENEYSVSHLCPQILVKYVTDETRKTYIVYSMYACLKTIKSLSEDIFKYTENHKKDYLNNTFVKCRIHQILRCWNDAQDLLNNIEDNGISVRRQMNTIDLAAFSSLLRNGSINSSALPFSSTLSFLLRQELELKIRNALGILQIRDKNTKEPIHYQNQWLLDFLFSNENINIEDSLSKNILLKIFEWCNYQIHAACNLFYWEYEIINSYITPLFSTKQTQLQINAYGGISMQKNYYETILKSELTKYIQNKTQNQNIEIIFMDKPEALLLLEDEKILKYVESRHANA